MNKDRPWQAEREREREVRIKRENEKDWTTRSPTDCMNVLETNRGYKEIEKWRRKTMGWK